MKKFGSLTMALALAMSALTAPATAFAGSYSGSIAVSYALTYCGTPGQMTSTGYNTNYTAFQSDCANFISQALFHGGWAEIGTNINNNSHWFYDGHTTNYISRTWRLVNNLEAFLQTSSRALGPFAVSSSTYSMYEPGDLVFADWEADGNPDHVYIVTAVYSNRLALAAHTTNRCGGSFDTIDVWTEKPGSYLYGYFLYPSF